MKSNGSGQPGGKRAGSDQKIASSFRFLDVVGLLVALSLGGWTLMDAIRPGSPRGSPEIYYGGLDDLDLGPRCDIKVVDGASLTAEEFDAFAATLTPVMVVNTIHNAAARRGWAASLASFRAAHGQDHVSLGSPVERGVFSGRATAEEHATSPALRVSVDQAITMAGMAGGSDGSGEAGRLDVGARMAHYVWTDGSKLLTEPEQRAWRSHPALAGWEEAEHARCWASTIHDGLERGRRLGALMDAKDPRTPAAVPVIALGAPGSGTPFHYHLSGISELLFGRKRWSFYPPGNVAPGLHAGTPRSHVRWLRTVLPTLVDGTRPMECMQSKGSVMFIPEGWNHATVNLAGDPRTGDTETFALSTLRNAEVDVYALDLPVATAKATQKNKKQRKSKTGDGEKKQGGKHKPAVGGGGEGANGTSSDRCASWYMEYSRAKAALAKGDFELAGHFNARALALNPTHGHLNFQAGFIEHGKLTQQRRGRRLSTDDQEHLFKLVVDAAHAYCLVYEPGGVVSDGDSDSAQLRTDCVRHIAGESCRDPPCVNLMN